MPNLTFPMGTLKKRADAYKKINNTIILGSLENEDLTDVEVVTLSQYARDCAYKQVMETCDVQSYEDIQIQIENLLGTSFNEAQEFISVDNERVTVGIDAERVDDKTVDKAMLLLIEVEDFSQGSYYTFGEPITIKANP